MFAPLVLPTLTTAAIFAALWCVGAVLLRTPKRITLLSLAAMILFIPSCIGVMAVVDSIRYGRFDYATANEIPDDGYIELPATAASITLYRSGTGHWARFTIDTTSLRAWVDERRALRPELNNPHDADEWTPRSEPSERPDTLHLNREIFQLKQENFDIRFPDTGWTYDPSMLELYVSRSDRGGGYRLWHAPSTGETYMSAGYW